jgi:AmpD protein
MRIDDEHWLTRTRRRPSPNSDPRPDPEDIALIVIHGISLPPGKFNTGLVEDLFLNRLDPNVDPALADLRDVQVSAHVLIDRRGRLTQFVPFDDRAWHAGQSCWQGRERCNDFSIGIELEGEDQRPYTQAQYRRLEVLLEQLLRRYPRLSRGAIVGHLEVAPGRKTDPGPAFDWQRLLRALW